MGVEGDRETWQGEVVNTQTMFEFREGLDASRLYETDSFLRLFKEV